MTRKAMVTLVSGLALVCGVIAPVDALGGGSRSHGASSRQDSATEIARRLVGSWRLESAVVRTPDGQVVGYPFTRNPEGKLTYTRDGHIWAYSAPRGRAGSERQAMWYTGRFRIDLRRREVVHRVRYSSVRMWEGTDLRRRYRFDGRRRLTLSTVEGMVLRWIRTGPSE